MKLSKALQSFEKESKADDSYWIEKAKLDYSIALDKQRRKAGLSFSALAQKIHTSAAYITKVFRGDSNLTIESMVKLSRATGGRLSIQIVDENINAERWISAFAKKQEPAANHPSYSLNNSVVLSNNRLAQKNGEQAVAA